MLLQPPAPADWKGDQEDDHCGAVGSVTSLIPPRPVSLPRYQPPSSAPARTHSERKFTDLLEMHESLPRRSRVEGKAPGHFCFKVLTTE